MISKLLHRGHGQIAGLLAAIIALGVLVVASPAGAAVTIAQSGSVGFWGGNEGTNVCGKDFYSTYIQGISPYISRTPAYPNHTQTIKTTTQVEQWTGTSWAAYRWDSGQVRTLPPGTQWALFTPTGDFTVAPGRYYRVVQFYEWRVNGVVVGWVTNLFDQQEYSAWGGWVAPTGSQASYCYIP